MDGIFRCEVISMTVALLAVQSVLVVLVVLFVLRLEGLFMAAPRFPVGPNPVLPCGRQSAGIS
ncbi:hypothetical protein AB0J38_44245 [Streptomyces sp. NPDC050095]|uniref:hypothetical protein n=1 Tax=unclassified Streptomyces TaxID=2593676 RepID=UPI0034458B09